MSEMDEIADLTRGVYRQSRWVTLSSSDCDLLPRRAGVYVVFSEGRPVYVGSSNDLKNRLASHFSSGVPHRRIYVAKSAWVGLPDLTVRYRESRRLGEYAMAEIRLIARLRPEWNCHHARKAVL